MSGSKHRTRRSHPLPSTHRIKFTHLYVKRKSVTDQSKMQELGGIQNLRPEERDLTVQ